MSNQPNNLEPELRPHTYDGIQEYDQRLPNWWLWTFYGAIIFTVIYWFGWFDSKVHLPDNVRIDNAMKRIEAARLAAVGTIDNDVLWQMSTNSSFVEAGHALFTEKCVVCHGANLEGGIGLNLADNEWKFGNSPMVLYKIVTDGSPNKASGMQAWAGELGPKKISQIVAYVLSHHSPESMAAGKVLEPLP